MTSNIWGDYFGNECNTRSKGLEDTYRKYLPDVIGVQEITEGWYKEGLFERLSDEYTLVEGWVGNYTPLMFRKNSFTMNVDGNSLKKHPIKAKALPGQFLRQKKTVSLSAFSIPTSGGWREMTVTMKYADLTPFSF